MRRVFVRRQHLECLGRAKSRLRGGGFVEVRARDGITLAGFVPKVLDRRTRCVQFSLVRCKLTHTAKSQAGNGTAVNICGGILDVLQKVAGVLCFWQRGVRSAVAGRRTAHQRRWALCRAWGCWRLAAATERARTSPPPSHETSAEMSPVPAQLHWRQPLLLRSC